MATLTPYQKKLLDPRWQRKRLEILNRDEWSCQGCGDKKTTLHVHHLKYKRSPWDIENSSLITYCELCHKFVEEGNKKFGDVKLIKKKIVDEHTLVTLFGSNRIVLFVSKKGEKTVKYLTTVKKDSLIEYVEILKNLA